MLGLLGNPRLIVLAIALIIVAGLGAIQTLPRAEDPRITNRSGFIITSWPGASAERVEALISEPIENIMRQLPEVDEISSTSRAGTSSVVLILKDEIYAEEAERVWVEARDKLEQIRLPADARKPFLDSDRNFAFTWIGALRWQVDTPPDYLLMARYAEELRTRLTNLPGTDLVQTMGAPEEEIQVDINPVDAVSVGLDAPQIADQLRRFDAKTSAGEIYNSRARISLEVEGAFEQLEAIRKVPLVAPDNGHTLQLGDIAEVRRAEAPMPSQLAIVHGERGIVVASRMLPDRRGDIWTEQTRRIADNFAAELPAEIGLETLFEQEVYTQARLEELLQNISLGFVLIVVVLFLTMGWRSAVLVAASLPLTILFALACMRFYGVPIHQMSVTGLIVALGIMVDNAIVVTDTVSRYRRDGLARLEAVAATVKHLWTALLGSTLTTILTFMPVVLMPGPAGEFIGPIALSVIFTLIGSWLISLFIIGPLAGRFLRPKEGRGLTTPRLGTSFRSLLRACLQRPRRSMAVIIILPLLGFWAAGKLPEQFFPPADRDMINLEVYLPVSASIRATEALTEQIRDHIDGIESVESQHWFIGRTAPSFYYNLIENRDGNQNYAQAMIKTRHFTESYALVARLQRELDEQFPEAQIVVQRLAQGPPAEAPVEFRLVGPDLEQLARLGDELKRIAMHTKDVVHVRASLNQSVPKYWLQVDPVAAQLAGVSMRDIADVTRANLDGVNGGSLLESTEELPVRVFTGGLSASDIDTLMVLPMLFPSGPNALMGVAGESLRPARASITRKDGSRTNNLHVFIRDGVLPAVVQARIEQRMAAQGFSLPQGYELETGGETENREEAVSKLMSSVGVIVVLLILTVVMAFNSFRLSGIIFAVAAQAAGLGLLSLALGGYPFGFTAIIGLMGLIGLAVNAAIVILIELKDSPEALAGDIEAVIDGVLDCCRHIASTTITTVMGLMPLLLSDSGFWPPFAMVLAGGTVLTTLLSLIFVPCAYWLMRMRSLRRIAADAQTVSSPA